MPRVGAPVGFRLRIPASGPPSGCPLSGAPASWCPPEEDPVPLDEPPDRSRSHSVRWSFRHRCSPCTLRPGTSGRTKRNSRTVRSPCRTRCPTFRSCRCCRDRSIPVRTSARCRRPRPRRFHRSNRLHCSRRRRCSFPLRLRLACRNRPGWRLTPSCRRPREARAPEAQSVKSRSRFAFALLPRGAPPRRALRLARAMFARPPRWAMDQRGAASSTLSRARACACCACGVNDPA